MPIFPGKYSYHQNGELSMAMLVYRSVLTVEICEYAWILEKKKNIRPNPTTSPYEKDLNTLTDKVPVEPHEAVAEVSRIGNV